ncbi:hypothetical protein [Devosia chinhatensis]|uniref:Uncharacterized protein n=1 Tax=Devosia chinhatensis TaxID=429727 RepID=A0A0F5FL55_9HYPH|nr:hypothetical protein [Devosia chinhatensis]KKB09614.1 hypothetical protein VE26_06965 [Devosia chinhatensis]
MRFAFVLVLVSAPPAIAYEDLALQIDRIAPLVNASKFEALGGPEAASAIVENIGGRWFTLVSTVRNWERDPQSNRERLEDAIKRTCADDWENIVTYTITGPDTFRVEQRSPLGEDLGLFEMEPVSADSRVFTTVVSDAYILEISGIENVPEVVRDAAIAEVRAEIEAGLTIWRPSDDLTVNVRADGEAEVWGRCPS